MKEYFVYILKCSDNSYYTGVTNNIDRRMEAHRTGYDKSGYTFSRRPIRLVFYEQFTNVKDAIAREKQIKGWRRSKKEALIANDWDRLKHLAHGSTGSL